jgi:amino acid transporter
VHAVLVAALAVYGSFIWNAILSAVARLVTYGLVCAAVVVLRVQNPEGPRFRLPCGWLLPLLGLAFCVLIGAQMDATHAQIVLWIVLAATLNWLWSTRRV